MSLVAYENSDISSDEEGEEDNEASKSTEKPPLEAQVIKSVSVAEKKPLNRLDNAADIVEKDSTNFANVLPKPKECHTSYTEEDITSRLLFSRTSFPKNSSGPTTSSANKSDDSLKPRNSSKGASANSAIKKTVKITLPSLSEFDEEEDGESKPKKLKPSAKGSGLFSLLPAPKNLIVKETNRKLIPRVVSKPPPPKVPSKPTLPPGNPQKSKSGSLINYADSGDESGEEGDEETDFFSLTGSTQIPVCPNPTIDLLNDPLTANPGENLLNQAGISSNYSEASTSSSAPIFPQRPSENDIVTPLPEALPEPQEENALQLDDDAINRLCGRRGREEIIEAQVIDVSGAMHLPDPKEWLTKQFTEEQETRSHSHRKRDGPTTQQRRKHQITYLAFQAKERELELKNQWAQNKMSRKQTQAKYGF
ncbi:proline-rich protein PRCC [Ischnura elegans]|uniref:proline-rich protein PRCC n=1 Tax=Ischnura elegans TaxID=197161 RepID=UPI001ED8AD3D|nr:proline-rich protein PRCC [Ischnura elegans]